MYGKQCRDGRKEEDHGCDARKGPLWRDHQRGQPLLRLGRTTWAVFSAVERDVHLTLSCVGLDNKSADLFLSVTMALHRETFNLVAVLRRKCS